jgi:hypothetical protein
MNPNTRISVHCYAGDGRQVHEMLAHHLSHECPITILSPDDSRVEITQHGVDSRFGGLQQSLGELSIQRQREHMKILLTYPENFFLMHDADSICLSPKLPAYLYEEPDTLWSNVVWNENQSERDASDREKLPHLAFQPPYFASRRTLEALLATSFPYHDQFDGFIDHFMMYAAVEAGIMWKGFPGGVSAAISVNNTNELQRAHVAVRHRGSVFVHGVKTPRFWQPLVEAHKAWVNDYRAAGDHRPTTQRVTTDGVRPGAHEYVAFSIADTRITYLRHGEGQPPPPQPQARPPQRPQWPRRPGLKA